MLQVIRELLLEIVKGSHKEQTEAYEILKDVVTEMYGGTLGAVGESLLRQKVDQMSHQLRPMPGLPSNHEFWKEADARGIYTEEEYHAAADAWEAREWEKVNERLQINKEGVLGFVTEVWRENRWVAGAELCVEFTALFTEGGLAAEAWEWERRADFLNSLAHYPECRGDEVW